MKLDLTTVQTNLQMIPWLITAVTKTPDWVVPATVKTQWLFWLNWFETVSQNPTALQGVVTMLNAATQSPTVIL